MRASRPGRGPRAARCGCGSGSRRSGRSASLPARLRKAGDHALVGDLAQADPAQAELPDVRARATAPLAAVVVACLVLGPALLAPPLARPPLAGALRLEALAGGAPARKRHPKRAKKGVGPLVGLGRRRD